MTKQKFELTYEDAIKALDCCCSLDNKCKHCPVYVVGGTCCSSSVLAHFLRNFIERQNAELERLKLPKFLVENTLSKKEMSEMLKMGRVGIIPHIDYSISRMDEDVIKTEVIKEFMKRANEKAEFLKDDDDYIGYAECVRVCHLESIAKKMVGGK